MLVECLEVGLVGRRAFSKRGDECLGSGIVNLNIGNEHCLARLVGYCATSKDGEVINGRGSHKGASTGKGNARELLGGDIIDIESEGLIETVGAFDLREATSEKEEAIGAHRCNLATAAIEVDGSDLIGVHIDHVNGRREFGFAIDVILATSDRNKRRNRGEGDGAARLRQLDGGEGTNRVVVNEDLSDEARMLEHRDEERLGTKDNAIAELIDKVEAHDTPDIGGRIIDVDDIGGASVTIAANKERLGANLSNRDMRTILTR